jgi:hypothetical protein
MNELETFVSFVGGNTASKIDQIRYIISDEFLNLIYFADNDRSVAYDEFLETYADAFDENGNIILEFLPDQEAINTWTGTPFTLGLSSVSCFHIEADAVSYNEFELNVISPTKIIFNPKNINTENKIYKIEYIFDFVNSNTPLTKTFFYNTPSEKTLNYPYSAEPGDPRNYPVDYTYVLEDELFSTKYALIKIYEFGKSFPSEILYTINISAVNADGPNGVFNEIHLISNKMFGPDDKILYTFESYNPQYILPVVVKWEETETPVVKKQKLKRINVKPYRVLSPFQNSTDDNDHIKNIEFIPSNSYNIDIGYSQTHNIITRDTKYYIKTIDDKYIRIGNYYNSNLNLPQPPLPIDTRWITDHDREFVITEDGENLWL